MTLRVFVDANVLHSRTLRDWTFLLRLEGADEMFQLHSTDDVVAETVRSLRRRFPLMRGLQMGHVKEQILASLDEIVPDFDPSIPYAGKDPNDRHVHAAAVAARADILLTSDRGLLEMPDQDDLPYEVYAPDDFFLLVDDSASGLVMRVTDRQRRYWSSKKKHRGLVGALQDAGCPKFADRVNGHLRTLSGPTEA